MGAKSITTTEDKIKSQEIIDDIGDVEMKPAEEALDVNKLAALKNKSKEKQEKQMAAKIVAKKERSLEFGIVGSGQGGSRLAECFYNLGYPSIVLNTANQDLKYINIPDNNKLLLDYSVGGAAKDLAVGSAASEMYQPQIDEMIHEKLTSSQINILCLSLGGGSGAGSVDVLVESLNKTGKPLVVITILPMNNEDVQTKQNSLITLSKLAAFAQNKKINNLIVVDNAKIESIYHNVSQMDFFKVANEAIVSTLDIFNTLSSAPSNNKPLDPMEFSKILIDGEGCSVYGELTVDNFEEPTSLAEAIINNLDNNLLAGQFDLKTTRYVGVIITANKETWSKIPSSSISYAMSMIEDRCSSPKGVFKGIYVVETNEPVVKVYSMFSGLLLPEPRIEQLKSETKELMQKSKLKDENRSLSLKLDTGTDENVSAAERVKNTIAQKNSVLGKMIKNTVVDRRK